MIARVFVSLYIDSLQHNCFTFDLVCFCVFLKWKVQKTKRMCIKKYTWKRHKYLFACERKEMVDGVVLLLNWLMNFFVFVECMRKYVRGVFVVEWQKFSLCVFILNDV